MSADDRFLGAACDLATESATTGGGPFGALVVRVDRVVATGTNRVTATADPTAHAEVEALRSAGAALGTHDLGGCVLYVSCQPCPMCLAAAWWARVDRVVYAATAADAAGAGFDDERFWAAVADPARSPAPPEHVAHPRSRAPFAAWAANADRTLY